MTERAKNPERKNEGVPAGFKWDLSDNNSVFNERPTLRQITRGKFPIFSSERDAKKFEKSYVASVEQSKQVIDQLVSPVEQEEWLSIIDSIDSLDKAWEVIGMVNAISYEDWQNRITNIDTYTPGDDFKFICHSISINPEYLQSEALSEKYVSCSLLSNTNTTVFGEGFGFIYGPEDLVAAYPHDAWINNHANNDEELFEQGPYKYQIPIINTIDCLEKECAEDDCSEVIIRKPAKPKAIFALGHDNYEKALALQKTNPDLKIIELPIDNQL